MAQEKGNPGQDAETYTVKSSVPLRLDGYNVQINPLSFYVEHVKGSSKEKATAYFTLRYYTTLIEIGHEDSDAPSGAVPELPFTYPVDKYGYCTNLKVEAYNDAERKKLLAEETFDIIRDIPVYKARSEVWNSSLKFKHGQFILAGDNVYMWDYPVEGNSSIAPDKDITQNEQDLPYKQEDKTHWILYQDWDMIATKVLFSQYALLGGAVMAGKMNAQGKYDYAKMFSQTGQDGTANYEKFKPELEAWSYSQDWKPNLCLDFLKGLTYANGGTFTNCTITDGCTIGGWKIGDHSLGLSNGEGGSNNGMFLYDNMIGFNDTDRQVIIGTTSILGAQFLGRFSDSSEGNMSSTGLIISVTGGSSSNTAIAFSGGCVSGMAEKVKVIDDNNAFTYLTKDATVVLFNNTRVKNAMTPSSMQVYDDGHKLSVKRIAGKAGGGDSLVRMVASDSNYFIINNGEAVQSFSIDAVGDAMTFYYVHNLRTAINGVACKGAWVQFKNPREW